MKNVYETSLTGRWKISEISGIFGSYSLVLMVEETCKSIINEFYNEINTKTFTHYRTASIEDVGKLKSMGIEIPFD